MFNAIKLLLINEVLKMREELGDSAFVWLVIACVWIVGVEIILGAFFLLVRAF